MHTHFFFPHAFILTWPWPGPLGSRLLYLYLGDGIKKAPPWGFEVLSPTPVSHAYASWPTEGDQGRVDKCKKQKAFFDPQRK